MKENHESELQTNEEPVELVIEDLESLTAPRVACSCSSCTCSCTTTTCLIGDF